MSGTIIMRNAAKKLDWIIAVVESNQATSPNRVAHSQPVTAATNNSGANQREVMIKQSS